MIIDDESKYIPDSPPVMEAKVDGSWVMARLGTEISILKDAEKCTFLWFLKVPSLIEVYWLTCKPIFTYEYVYGK